MWESFLTPVEFFSVFLYCFDHLDQPCGNQLSFFQVFLWFDDGGPRENRRPTVFPGGRLAGLRTDTTNGAGH